MFLQDSSWCALFSVFYSDAVVPVWVNKAEKDLVFMYIIRIAIFPEDIQQRMNELLFFLWLNITLVISLKEIEYNVATMSLLQ